MFQGVFAWILEKSISHSVVKIHIKHNMQKFAFCCVYKNVIFEFTMYHGRSIWPYQDGNQISISRKQVKENIKKIS